MAPSATTARNGSPPRDELDDLLDYDAGDDVFRPLSPLKPQSPNDKSKDAGDGKLGIDKEVEVEKVRVPRVKLDEARLLSERGIPKLRKKARDLKFKGKGHEFSDAQRLLTFYQLWLDDLFPKARFLDALAMVEKAGHKKTMQMKRMEWIGESKPKQSYESEQNDALFEEPVVEPRRASADGDQAVSAQASGRIQTPPVDSEMRDDIYSATPLAERAKTGGASSLFVPDANMPSSAAPDDDDMPIDDDLDALLAEDMGNNAPVPPTTSKAAPREELDDDELEAMAEMDGLW